MGIVVTDAEVTLKSKLIKGMSEKKILLETERKSANVINFFIRREYLRSINAYILFIIENRIN